MKPLIVIICALSLLCLCLAGLWAQAFRDNWLQWTGLWGMVVGMAAVFWPSASELRELGAVDAVIWRVNDVGPRDLLVMLAALSFAAGNAIKVWRHRHPKPRDRATPHTYEGA